MSKRIGWTVCLVLSLLAAACAPMPSYELAPTNDAVRAALKARFAAAHQTSGPLAPCSDYFSIASIAVREQAMEVHTNFTSYSMHADAAYTATLLKPVADRPALIRDCFSHNARAPEDWPVGEQRIVELSAGLLPSGGAWNLAISSGVDKQPDETIALAPAPPHTFKVGINATAGRP